MKEEGKCGELREGSPDLGKKQDEVGRRRKRDLGRLNGFQADRTESALQDKGQPWHQHTPWLWPETCYTACTRQTGTSLHPVWVGTQGPLSNVGVHLPDSRKTWVPPHTHTHI